jgi:hypothetical protein
MSEHQPFEFSAEWGWLRLVFAMADKSAAVGDNKGGELRALCDLQEGRFD